MICRYVKHDEVEMYAVQGWRLVHTLHDCHHGRYRVLMCMEDREKHRETAVQSRKVQSDFTESGKTDAGGAG